jgi:hypothetical protein
VKVHKLRLGPLKTCVQGVQTGSTPTLALPGGFESELVVLVESRREANGQLVITRLKEFFDSVKMNEFFKALTAQTQAAA